MSENIKQKAVTSVVWSFIEKISVQGVSFVISLLLARILLPEDYGTIAILTIFIAVATVFIDGGFSNALIQNQNRTERDFTTAFWTNVGIAAFCYFLLFIGAPYMAIFFEQPLLKDVIKVYGISLIISSFGLAQKARFYIAYNFKIIATISLVAIIIGGIIAILMAYNGFGVWSLVYYHIVVESLRTIGLWTFGQWCPSLNFSLDSFKNIFNFGSKLLGANMLNVISSNLYTFVVGKLFNATNLGFYSRGQSIAYIFPSNFSNIMHQASYPVFCEIQNDRERLKTYFSKYIQISFMLCAPVMTLLAVLASPIIELLLTERWLPCVFYIQVLAIGYMFDPVMRLNTNVINVTGHSEYSLYAEIWKKVALLLILLTTCFISLKAMTVGLALYSLFDMLIVSIYVKRVVNLSFWGEFKLLLPIIGYCILLGATTLFASSLVTNIIVKITIGVLAGCFVYILLLCIFSKQQMRDIICNSQDMFRQLI